MMGNTAETVLQLIRKALDNSYQIELSENIDWTGVIALASGHGVITACLEGVKFIPAETLPKQALLQLIGLSEMYRLQYEQAWAVACELDKLWAASGIHATVLKGRSIAQYYPEPYHRYSCDLDVFIGEEWEQACNILEEQGIRLVHEVYKEVEFTFNNVSVECHRYITPLRGNVLLKDFERYLRSLLDRESITCFEGTTLVCPPIMFTVMLYVEHALGDFLHGHFSLKHVVDWVYLRLQTVDWESFRAKCKKFKFDRFLALIDTLADVVEGKKEYESLSTAYKEVFDEMLRERKPYGHHTWFQRRLHLFFGLINNRKKFRDYGYTSMPSFLLNSVWTHFFNRDVVL